jgi:hypothetical protein
MHNCKATRKRLIEQAMDKPPCDQSEPWPADLEGCPTCLEEFASVGSLLRVVDQAMESAQPAESFWIGYEARLRQALERDSVSSDSSFALRSKSKIGALIRLQNLFTAYVRVPVPVAAVVIALFGLSVVLAMHSRRHSTEPISGTASVVTKTVEVPVVHERLVTRVVFRERRRLITQARATQMEGKRSAANATNRRNAAIENTPASLVGFKPANEARLTIIKGSYRDEK